MANEGFSDAESAGGSAATAGGMGLATALATGASVTVPVVGLIAGGLIMAGAAIWQGSEQNKEQNRIMGEEKQQYNQSRQDMLQQQNVVEGQRQGNLSIEKTQLQNKEQMANHDILGMQRDQETADYTEKQQTFSGAANRLIGNKMTDNRWGI